MRCVSSVCTLLQINNSAKKLDLNNVGLDSSFFRSFSVLVRRALGPAWHRVRPKTRRLVGDLVVLRRLITYLLTYDPFAFLAYLETVIASNSHIANSNTRQRQSQWLFTDAADKILRAAKRRCSTGHPVDSTICQNGGVSTLRGRREGQSD